MALHIVVHPRGSVIRLVSRPRRVVVRSSWRRSTAAARSVFRSMTNRAAPSVGERLYTAPITAGFGVRVTHEVTDEAFAADRGEYEALCGCVFIPAPLAAPPGRSCPACLDILAAARRAAALAGAHQPHRRRHHRHRLLRRLVPVRQGQRATTGQDITR